MLWINLLVSPIFQNIFLFCCNGVRFFHFILIISITLALGQITFVDLQVHHFTIRNKKVKQFIFIRSFSKRTRTNSARALRHTTRTAFQCFFTILKFFHRFQHFPFHFFKKKRCILKFHLSFLVFNTMNTMLIGIFTTSTSLEFFDDQQFHQTEHWKLANIQLKKWGKEYLL